MKLVLLKTTSNLEMTEFEALEFRRPCQGVSFENFWSDLNPTFAYLSAFCFSNRANEKTKNDC